MVRSGLTDEMVRSHCNSGTMYLSRGIGNFPNLTGKAKMLLSQQMNTIRVSQDNVVNSVSTLLLPEAPTLLSSEIHRLPTELTHIFVKNIFEKIIKDDLESVLSQPATIAPKYRMDIIRGIIEYARKNMREPEVHTYSNEGLYSEEQKEEIRKDHEKAAYLLNSEHYFANPENPSDIPIDAIPYSGLKKPPTPGAGRYPKGITDPEKEALKEERYMTHMERTNEEYDRAAKAREEWSDVNQVVNAMLLTVEDVIEAEEAGQFPWQGTSHAIEDFGSGDRRGSPVNFEPSDSEEEEATPEIGQNDESTPLSAQTTPPSSLTQRALSLFTNPFSSTQKSLSFSPASSGTK